MEKPHSNFPDIGMPVFQILKFIDGPVSVPFKNDELGGLTPWWKLG